VQSIGGEGENRTVTFTENGKTQTVETRLVVGADGRSSRMREWGDFTVERDPDFLRIAGTVVEGTSVPDDGVHLAWGEGVVTFLAPLGKKRARMYFVYPGPTGDRKLSGKEKLDTFFGGIRGTNLPASWFEGLTVTGPLAEFEGADQWVKTPGKPGVALIGDAAGATDPSWGCGLSKTMVDIESLANCLNETDDWSVAAKKYGESHDDSFGRLHRILGAMTALFWSPGPEADARRQSVMGKMKVNPMAYPDSIGMGPFGPSDDKACKLLLDLD
jgi:2-polyprenyl-6-methoxyphenol hydroxylase-like FAD-dependent oxidoreductase